MCFWQSFVSIRVSVKGGVNLNTNISSLEKVIGYTFKDKELIKKALTHSSYAFERQKGALYCNERLEFLGDAVLEVVSSEFIYLNNETMSEGDMSRLRASLVCEESLAQAAAEIGLGEYLYVGHGEDRSGGRRRASVTSDAMEAVIGAIFLDGGFTNAKDFIHKYILNDIENKTLFYDSKTILQEVCQRDYKYTPVYELISESGPDHKKTFEMAVILAGKVIGTGRGGTKKGAQQHAAFDALTKLKYKRT